MSHVTTRFDVDKSYKPVQICPLVTSQVGVSTQMYDDRSAYQLVWSSWLVDLDVDWHVTADQHHNKGPLTMRSHLLTLNL